MLHDFDEGICFPYNDCYENGRSHFYSDHSNGCEEEKNASLGNSMLNHLEHITLTSWMFLKFLSVVGIIEI